MAKCRSCNAEIVFAKTPAGKAMPVNEQPAPNGNVALIVRDGVKIAVVLDRSGRAPTADLQPSPDAPRYISHFATCPGAAGFRK